MKHYDVKLRTHIWEVCFIFRSLRNKFDIGYMFLLYTILMLKQL